MSSYDEITKRIINELEKGNIPWKMKWMRGGGAFSRVTNKPYNFINQLLLGDDHEYVTFNRIRKENGHLNKGSKAKYVYGWKLIEETIINDEGEEEVKKHWILRCTPVFDVLDTNLEPTKRVEGLAVTDKNAEEVVDTYIKYSKVKFDNGFSNQAYYSESQDKIVVPNVKQFNDTSEYYDTVFHEMTHSTGHKSRLGRLNGDVAAFGGESYSKEELIAEMGSAMLINKCGLETTEQFENAAAYIGGWLKSLKNDKRLVVEAASKAEKAVDYILNIKNN